MVLPSLNRDVDKESSDQRLLSRIQFTNLKTWDYFTFYSFSKYKDITLHVRVTLTLSGLYSSHEFYNLQVFLTVYGEYCTL